MARRILVIHGESWEVSLSGRTTVYGKDEFGLMFVQGTGPDRRRRFTRFSPTGSRSPDAALRELSARELLGLFQQSQPAWTAPESAHGAR